MTRRHLLAVTVIATTVIVMVASSCIGRSRAHHPTAHPPADTATLVAAATRFASAATGPSSRSTSWSTLAVPALARALAQQRAASCRAAANVLDVAVTPGNPALAFVTARCPDTVDGQPIALAWSLKLIETPAGWRVEQVTS